VTNRRNAVASLKLLNGKELLLLHTNLTQAIRKLTAKSEQINGRRAIRKKRRPE
jgi:hypothetical protein